MFEAVPRGDTVPLELAVVVRVPVRLAVLLPVDVPERVRCWLEEPLSVRVIDEDIVVVAVAVLVPVKVALCVSLGLPDRLGVMVALALTLHEGLAVEEPVAS